MPYFDGIQLSKRRFLIFVKYSIELIELNELINLLFLEYLDCFQFLFIYANRIIHHLFIFLKVIFLCLGAEIMNSTFFFFFLKSTDKLLSRRGITSYTATKKYACVHVIIFLQLWIFSEYLLFWYNINNPISHYWLPCVLLI